MSVVIKIIGLVDGRPSPYEGQYLKSCDVDGRDGRGAIFTTSDPADAMVFEHVGEAHAYWMRESTVVPRRPDGKPNRPLTGYSIEMLPLDATDIESVDGTRRVSAHRPLVPWT